MELAHNVIHGQWDWMNDPEIHSETWEWDMVGPSSHWRSSHNHRHHMFTNVVGVDDDLGFGVLRVTRDQEWRPATCSSRCARCCWLAFEWGVAFHGLYSITGSETTEAGKSAHKTAMLRKMARQAAKDYVLFPALSRRRWRRVLGANVVAQRVSQRVGLHRHRLRSLRGRCGEVRAISSGG